MQVKKIDINTGKIMGYGICKKKLQNLIIRWSYHSDLLYNVCSVCFILCEVIILKGMPCVLYKPCSVYCLQCVLYKVFSVYLLDSTDLGTLEHTALHKWGGAHQTSNHLPKPNL